jgi:tRNA pseudouridine13 synthase
MSSGACAELEQASILPWAALAQGLEAQGLQQERRALRLQVAGLRHHGAASELHLEFTLARGCYATCVLRELIDTGRP